MSKDNNNWFDNFEDGFDDLFEDKADTTLINDDRAKKDQIRSRENQEYAHAADEYERYAKSHRQDPRERRLNTGGSHSGGSGLYNDRSEPVYDGYERSGAAYDRAGNRHDNYNNGYGNGYAGLDPRSQQEAEERAQRARNLANEAMYKEKAAREAELRRLSEESMAEESHKGRKFLKGRKKGDKSGGVHGATGHHQNHKKEKKLRKNGKKKGKWRIVRRVLLALLIVILIFCGYFLILTSHFDKVDVGEDDLAIDPKVADELSGYRNIAVLGSDARANEKLDGSRTDAIIILSIKKINGDINMISIMRDSYLKLENADKQLVLDKITHAHHWGGGRGTVAALNRSLDLNIKEFVIFDWQAVADTIDALGGITVDIKKNEIRDLNKWGPETGRNVGRKYKKITHTGTQEIDGVQGTTYCRIRKTSGGDPGRGSRYKKVMAAVMKKGITHPWKLHTLANDVFPNIRTNMSSPGMLWAVLRAPGYDIKKSYGWPKNYYGGILGNGLWYAVPRTLENNVKWLHRKAFDQKGYNPSDTCKEINNEIITQTGVQ